MYYLKSALKIISYILVSIVLVLFFAFILTYNFEEVPENKAVSEEVLKTELKEKIDEALNDKTLFNELEVSLGSKITNDLLLYTLDFYTNNTSYQTEYWDLKKIAFSIEDRKLCVTLFADFKDKINYSLKIRAYFDVSYKDKEFVLEFSKFKFGAITIPDRIVSKILNRIDDNTIGFLVNDAIKRFSYIEYRSDELKLVIKEEKLLKAISSGDIGEFFFENVPVLKITGSQYINTLFKNNLIDVSVDDGIVVKIYGSKIMNEYNPIDRSNYESVINDIKNNKEIELNNPGIILDYNNLDIINQKSLLMNYLGSNIIVEDKNLYLTFNYNFLTFNTSLSYEIIYEDKIYKIKSVTIGKDNSENELSYLTIDPIQSYEILESFNIRCNKDNNSIYLEDLFKVDSLTIETIEINESTINLTYLKD